MPASGVSVPGEDALVVARMPAAGVGDAGVSGMRNAPVTRLRTVVSIPLYRQVE
jgi:hypothetical protein